MIHIPSEEIRQPRLHADTLGFTFVWNGHFLRGIYPGSTSLAMSYFDSGFLDDVVNKGLFPKTWISDFENEQFGMIIEHEMISPVLYATEWNSAMLRDAALMVLDIAKIGWGFGYNMVDCHKLNVMFKNNKPIYVDLGSFIPKDKGCTGWIPYTSFLQSYYYILKMWAEGAPIIAKRMMAPGIEMPINDYYACKSELYRRFPSLVKAKKNILHGMCRLAVIGDEEVSKQGPFVKILKLLVNCFKPSPSQHLDKLKRKVKRIKILSSSVSLQEDDRSKIIALTDVIMSHFYDVHSVIFIDNRKSGYYESLSRINPAYTYISLHQDDACSCREYSNTKSETKFSSVSVRLLNNTVLIKNKLPETRLRSDIGVITCFTMKGGDFGVNNSVVFIEQCLMYTSLALIVGVEKSIMNLQKQLEEKYRVEVRLLDNLDIEGYLIVYK